MNAAYQHVSPREWAHVRKALAANPFSYENRTRDSMNGTRTFVAAAMVVLMGGVLLVALLRPAPEKAFSQDIQLVLITALVTKFGTVIDWLFGSSNGREGPRGTEGDPVQTESRVVNPEPIPVTQTPDPEPEEPTVVPPTPPEDE